MNNLPIILSDATEVRHSTDQCDCACTSTRIATSTPCSPFSLATLDHDRLQRGRGFAQPLDVEHVIYYSMEAPAVVLSRSALHLLMLFDQPLYLHAGLTQFANQWGDQVLQTMLARFISLGILGTESQSAHLKDQAQDTLSVWIHLSDRCNLRCTYCYVPYHSDLMTMEIGRKVIDATIRSAYAHGYTKVQIKYAGGEPLLNFALLVDLQQYACRLAASHGIDLDAVVLSNGTLLSVEMIATIRQLGLRLMISLDGVGAIHDTQRPYVNGQGSFIDVTRGVDLACAYGLIPDISITITRHSVTGLPELIDWVLERNLPFSLNFYRHTDHAIAHRQLYNDEQIIINKMIGVFKVIENSLPQRSLLASLVDRANLAIAHKHTCSVGYGYLVYDCHGRVTKCQMQMDTIVSTVDSIDPLADLRNTPKGVRNVSVDTKQGCRDCEWRYWCTGGCPLETFLATGRFDVKSPNCHIYQRLYPEVLRLEGLRLLRYAPRE